MSQDCAGCTHPATRTVDGIWFCDYCGPGATFATDWDNRVKRIVADHYLTNHPELRTHHDRD